MSDQHALSLVRRILRVEDVHAATQDALDVQCLIADGGGQGIPVVRRSQLWPKKFSALESSCSAAGHTISSKGG